MIEALGVIAILLSACSTKDVENKDGAIIVEEVEPNNTDGEAEAAPADDFAGDETQLPVLEDASAAYPEIYKQIITEKEGDAVYFSLIYLDEDDIPELAVCDRGYDTYSIYAVKDGEAFCMVDNMATVEMEYFERSGIVSAFARWNGGGDEGGYGCYYYRVCMDKTLVDGELPVLHDTYDAVCDEEGNWTGTGVTKYFYMDQEIDEAAYQQKQKELGIKEDSGISVNGIEKNEIMNILTPQDSASVSEEVSGYLTEEEELLNERMEYYRKSAYYEEILDYWENTREVRDVLYRIEPLYESDHLYLTKEMVASDPPVVIHLAKNEIYARHGYIFKDPDLYNYFMGCIWYTPAVAPEDFSDEVFNECEKENLKLLGKLDTFKNSH